MNGKIFSIIGLVCGCLSVFATFFFWIPFVGLIFLFFGVAGIVLSIIGKKQMALTGESAGLATAGLIVSIIGACLCATVGLACTICECVAMCETNSIYDDYNDAYNAVNDLYDLYY